MVTEEPFHLRHLIHNIECAEAELRIARRLRMAMLFVAQILVALCVLCIYEVTKATAGSISMYMYAFGIWALGLSGFTTLTIGLVTGTHAKMYAEINLKRAKFQFEIFKDWTMLKIQKERLNHERP